ncbi:hypothetical protein, partial [Streptomyces sp. NPDC047453]|uniref:hypothetical protein n=1 Tax=Streptomyces sp. NPDC047453 TaxID=3154812 RepID=UPI0033D92588
DLDHQGQSQTKITKWVTFDPPSEGQRSAVVENGSARGAGQAREEGALTESFLKDRRTGGRSARYISAPTCHGQAHGRGYGQGMSPE